MRVTIVVEGQHLDQGRFVAKGALKWEEGVAIPVTLGTAFDRPPIGIATDIRREEDGRITAELDLDAYIFANALESSKEDGVQTITSAQLKAINLIRDSTLANPAYSIGDTQE